jgi:SAM-dependent methyltransferase
MITTTKDFIEKLFKKYPSVTGDKVLEVGSLDVNGTVKDLLLTRYKKYTGIDMRIGPNVDLCINGHDIRKHFKKESFDMVFCVDTIEHDIEFWKTISNMKWVLKKGGWMILGAPSRGHPFHAHPSDYYRFFETAIQSFFCGWKHVFTQTMYFSENKSLEDQVYGWGQKP